MAYPGCMSSCTAHEQHAVAHPDKIVMCGGVLRSVRFFFRNSASHRAGVREQTSPVGLEPATIYLSLRSFYGVCTVVLWHMYSSCFIFFSLYFLGVHVAPRPLAQSSFVFALGLVVGLLCVGVRQLCNVGAWTVMASTATRMGIMEIAAHQLMLSLWMVIGFVQGVCYNLRHGGRKFDAVKSCNHDLAHEEFCTDFVLYILLLIYSKVSTASGTLFCASRLLFPVFFVAIVTSPFRHLCTGGRHGVGLTAGCSMRLAQVEAFCTESGQSGAFRCLFGSSRTPIPPVNPPFHTCSTLSTLSCMEYEHLFSLAIFIHFQALFAFFFLERRRNRNRHLKTSTLETRCFVSFQLDLEMQIGTLMCSSVQAFVVGMQQRRRVESTHRPSSKHNWQKAIYVEDGLRKPLSNLAIDRS